MQIHPNSPMLIISNVEKQMKKYPSRTMMPDANAETSILRNVFLILFFIPL